MCLHALEFPDIWTQAFFLSKFVFVYQRGMIQSGSIALDDIAILPGDCNSQPPIGPQEENGTSLL